MLPENERIEFEDRVYLNPQVGLDEKLDFIDNLRATQAQQNQQIKTDTYNLGTEVPSNLGGLTGAESYFSSRYQTPQTNAATANLRATAQATALNQALQNEQDMWKKRYNQAYRAYQKRQNPKTPTTTTEGGVEYEDNTYSLEGNTPGVAGGYTVANVDTENNTILGYTGVPYGEEGQTNYTINLEKQPETANATLPNGTTVSLSEDDFEYVMDPVRYGTNPTLIYKPTGKPISQTDLQKLYSLYQAQNR